MPHASWILILSLLILKATWSQAGLQALLREIENANNNSGGRDPEDYGVELFATDFDGVVNGTAATYAIVEFSAYWCHACKNYKPHFEKVARLFNGPDAVHPGVVLMARVDCAFKVNMDLCNKFRVSAYPTLFWGPATKFTSGWKPNEANSEIREIDEWRTAERLLNWINNQIGSSYGLDDGKQRIRSEISDPVQAKKEIGVKVCALVRELLVTDNNKLITGESKLAILGVNIVARLVKEFGVTVEEDSARTISTFVDVAHLIQKLCSEETA